MQGRKRQRIRFGIWAEGGDSSARSLIYNFKTNPLIACFTNSSSITNVFSSFGNVKLSNLEKILVFANMHIYFGTVMCYNI